MSFFHCLGRFFFAGAFFFWLDYIVHFEILLVTTSAVGIPWDWFVLHDEFCLLEMRITRVIFNKHLYVEMCLNWAENLQPGSGAVVLLRNSALSWVVWTSLGIIFPF